MIGSGRRWPLAAVTGALALMAGIAMLHVVHAAAGHRALATFGPAIAALVALTLALLPYDRVRWDTRVTLGAGVFLLLLGGEWLESELTAGHDLAIALRDHGQLVAVTLGATAGLGALVHALRVLDALFDVFSTRRG